MLTTKLPYLSSFGLLIYLSWSRKSCQIVRSACRAYLLLLLLLLACVLFLKLLATCSMIHSLFSAGSFPASQPASRPYCDVLFYAYITHDSMFVHGIIHTAREVPTTPIDLHNERLQCGSNVHITVTWHISLVAIMRAGYAWYIIHLTARSEKPIEP